MVRELVIDVLSSLGVKYAVGFVVFFSMSAVAVYYHRRPRVRKAWTVLFVIMLFVPVIVGSNWPFLAWALFSEPGPTEYTEYQTFGVESDGDLVRYDTRALGPVTGAVFRGYAEKMATEWNGTTVERLGQFITHRANEYRSQLRGSYSFRPDFWVPNGFRFPRHQLDYRWPPEVVRSDDRFVGVVLYRIDATIQPDGQAIETVSCSPVRVLPGAGIDRDVMPALPATPPLPVCNR